MMSAIEDAIISAARGTGFQINSAVMQTVAIDLAGSSLDGAMITIPNKGTLSIKDYLADLYSRAPSGFSKVQPNKPDSERTLGEMHRKRPLDAAWHARRARATGLTKAFMDEISRNRA